MEQVRDKHKVAHQLHRIQYNDKAISNLKWNKKTEKRHRIKVSFKNNIDETYSKIPYKILNKKYNNLCGLKNAIDLSKFIFKLKKKIKI